MEFTTCDLYDKFEGVARVPKVFFQDFGARKRFYGQIATVKCYEDNSRVKELCSKPGNGRVLVVDGGGSIRCALLGDLIAKAAVENAWAGGDALFADEDGILLLDAQTAEQTARRD
jgi:regulator of ribonuclease activity A